METPTFFAELAYEPERWRAIVWILFWLFLVAALVWLIVWLLFWDDGESDEAPASPERASAKKKEPKKAKAEKPASAPKGDDFTKLGLAAGTGTALLGAGVTKYSQIADWSDDDVSANAASFGSENPKVDFKDLPWKANALANGVDPDSVGEGDAAFGPPHSAPDKVDHDMVMAKNFSGEDVKNDADLGVVYEKGVTPNHEDDLSAIKGVGPKISKELNDYGVFCYKQIANWSNHNVSEFAERLNCFKGRIERDRWIPQAAGLDCPDSDDDFSAATADEAASQFADELSAGTVKQDEVYGIVYLKKPDEIDDLKKVKGIGKVFEGKLHEIGVYRFKQIAVWTDSACQEFSKMLTFKDRIYRDNWLDQAKDFHDKKYDDKL